MGDGVDSDVVATSVRCPSGHDDVHPDEATMGGADCQSSWLSDNCRVRAEPVSALSEQHAVRHVGVFKLLEDQPRG